MRSNLTSSTFSKSPCHKIVIVDDEPAFRSVLQEILKTFGFVVHAYDSVENAMQHLEENIPDLILTDLMMPDIDGYQFMQTLQMNPRFNLIPVVVISALAQPEDKELSKSTGAAAYLTKPFTAKELRQVINKVLDL
ncbi:MAG: response regulator [Anaerolineales bacterium]|nr:response regulator [Anaerolineales bacterium]